MKMSNNDFRKYINDMLDKIEDGRILRKIYIFIQAISS